MARCIDCAWFPWEPGANLSGIAVTMACYPNSPRRRWTNEGAASEHTCEYFKPRMVMNPAPEVVQEIIAGESETAEPEKPKANKRKR
ncbi:MAG: hypothetical protein HPY52_10765 [Firmicutes bacterium]|nr:hypothetical protein [Bacillota bacterium]